MNVFEMEKEFNDLIKQGQELIEKLKQAKEPVKEATEEDIGKLCKFWDDDTNDKNISVLKGVRKEGSYPFYHSDGSYGHCRRLTPAEVAEITGYKVEEN